MEVEKYRQYWKPNKVKILLLAESHVYTNQEDFNKKIRRTILRLLPNYPSQFTRFVYCLGYGESDLLENRMSNLENRGTPDYWKIFSACAGKDKREVLKTKTLEINERFRNKINLLEELKERGIWLLDASIVAVNKTKKIPTKCAIIKSCWESYLKKTIQDAMPERIIVINYKTIEDSILSNLSQLNIPLHIIPQPRAQTQEYYNQITRLCGENPPKPKEIEIKKSNKQKVLV